MQLNYIALNIILSFGSGIYKDVIQLSREYAFMTLNICFTNFWLLLYWFLKYALPETLLP